MKKPLLIMLCLITQMMLYAQQKKTVPNPYSNLSEVSTLIQWSDIHNSMSTLPSNTLSRVRLFKTLEILEGFTLSYSYGDANHKKQASLLKKYSPQVKEYLDGTTRFGESASNVYLYDEENLPFGFSQYKSGLVFYQTGIYSDHAYNTLRLSADERALKAAKDIALPTVFNMKPMLQATDVKYFLIIVSYTVKDFSSDSDYDADTETIGLILSKTSAQKYIHAELTDQELLKLSTLFNLNKATGINLRKISTM